MQNVTAVPLPLARFGLTLTRTMLSLTAAAYVCFATCCDAVAGTFRTITIDNAYADWAGVPILDSDIIDNFGGPDIATTQVCNDGNNLYIRNTYHNGLALDTFTSLDVDSNTATGYNILTFGLVGSEASWQNDFGFAQAPGIFIAGPLRGPYFFSGLALLAPIADAPSRELAISLDATYGGGIPLFPDGTFTLLIWTADGAFDVSAAITYTLAVCPNDINGSGAVNVDDLLQVINTWGPCPPPCPADSAPPGGNGSVNVDDLLAVINAWGKLSLIHI